MKSDSTPRQIRMTIPDLVAAAVSCAAAIWAFIESARWPAPEFVGGPAAVPRLIAVILLIIAGTLAWSAIQGRSFVIRERLDGAKKKRLAIMLAVTVAYAWALEPVGFLPATMIYLGVFALVLGVRNRLVIASYALLLPTVFYLVFSTILKVPLPPAYWPF
jgi:putative tricarboxylic transport membrane protein